MDTIKIDKLSVYAYHGCEESEKINGQEFFIDADLHVDMSASCISDNLDDTVNYAEVCEFINKFFSTNRYDLIEAAAEQTARAVLKQFPKIREIDMTVNKPSAPIELKFGNVAVQITRKWHKAYLSIGSNIGDREAYLNQAVDAIYDDDNCRVTAVSKFIQTKPYGPVEQDDFLNGCLEIETLYAPMELLRAVNEIERQADRKREIHWGPRTLDIDIILYDDEIVAEDTLYIPHREMHKRAFVLEPLNQIAPYAINPVNNKTVSTLLEELYDGTGKSACRGCSGCAGCDKV